MGWFWRNDSSSSDEDAGKDITDGFCITTKVERSFCETKMVKGGKFVRKCQTTKEIRRHRPGKPYSVVQTNTVYTEEDLTALPKQDEEKLPLLFVDMGIDVEAIKRQMKSLMKAAERMNDICIRGMRNINNSRRTH